MTPRHVHDGERGASLDLFSLQAAQAADLIRAVVLQRSLSKLDSTKKLQPYLLDVVVGVKVMFSLWAGALFCCVLHRNKYVLCGTPIFCSFSLSSNASLL